MRLRPHLLLLGLLATTLVSRAQFAGPVSESGLKNGVTLTYDGQQIGLGSDGNMARPVGKTVTITNVVLAGSTTVYWAPTLAGISLDDRTVSAGEMVRYDPNASSLAQGIAIFSGTGYLSTLSNAHQPISIRLRLVATKNGAALPLVATNAIAPGVGVPLSAGATHTISLHYEAWNGGAWEAAYSLFDRTNNTYADIGAAYSFGYGFFYDGRPIAVQLSAASINENNVSGAIVAALSVNDPSPTAQATTYSLTGGAGSDHNVNFSTSGASLLAAKSFNYEADARTQRVRIRATNQYGFTETPLTVTLNDLNEAPTAVNLSSSSVAENLPVGTTIGTLSITDPDTLNPVFVDPTFEFVTNAGAGYANNLFTLSGSTLSTAQVFDFEAQSSYRIKVKATDARTLSVGRNAITADLTITIANANDAPVALPVTLTAYEDQPFVFPWSSFTPRFTDQDTQTFPNTLTYLGIASGVTNGTLQFNGAPFTFGAFNSATLGLLVYRGNANYNGSESLVWDANDSLATGPSAAITLVVTPVNDPPFINQPAAITIDEDANTTTSYVLALTGLSTGPANESTQAISSITGTILSLNGNNIATASGLLGFTSGSPANSNFQFRTVQDANGTATLRLTVKDNGGTDNGGIDTLTRDVTLTVRPVDDPPVLLAAIPAQNMTGDDPPRTIDLTPYFKDVDSTLTYTVTANTKDTGTGNAIPTLATTQISGSNLVLTLTPYSYGTGSITVQAAGLDVNNPTAPAKTVSSTFSLAVAFKDHPPAATASAPTNLVITEDTGALTVPLDGWFADPDLDTFSAVSVNPASIDQTYLQLSSSAATLSGTVSGAIRGSLTLTPQPHAFTAYTRADGTYVPGNTSITLTATSGGRSVSYSVPVTINDVNDPPTLATIGDQFINQDLLPHYVALAGIGPGPGEGAIDQVVASSLTATGGAGGVIDPTSLAITAYNPANGTAQLTYKLLEFKSGVDTITVSLADARGATTTQTFTVKVNHVNQAPRAVSPLPPVFANAPTQDGLPVFTFLEDQTGGTMDTSALFWDPDGDTIRQSVFANTNPALIALSAASATAGQWNVALQPDQTGTTDLVFRATDGYLTGDYGVRLTVTPVNDPPTLDPVASQRIDQAAAPRTIALTGLSTGPANESAQALLAITPTVTASSTPNLITSVSATLPNPNVSASTGSLTFAVSDTASGTATIRVTVQDNGGTDNGGVDTFWREFTVTVNPVDDAPSLQRPAGTITVLEDQFATANYQYSADLTGTFADRARDPITLRIASGDKISDPANVLDNETPGRVLVPSTAPESILLTFVPDGFGTATITYDAMAKGLISSQQDTLTIVVTPVNDPPTMRAPAPQNVNQGGGPFTLPLRNLTPGPANESAQTVAATGVAIVTESVTGLITSAALVPADDSSYPAVRYTVAPSLTGTATLRVTLQDNGGTANGGVDTATFDFTVTVGAVDDPPVLSGSYATQRFLEDQFAANRNETTLDLTGVFTDPDGDAVSLLLTATGISDPDDILDDESRLVVVDGTNPQRINVTFKPDRAGRATLTVGGTAGNQTAASTLSFDIVVTPVNDAPTLTTLGNLALTTDSGPQTVALTGISPGPPEESAQQVTSLTAAVVSTSTPGLIDPASLAVSYTPGAATGTLTFTPGSGLTGTATIAVTAQDNGGTDNGGVDTFARQFLVTVAFADRPPVLTAPKGTVTFSEDDFPGNGTNVRSIDLSGVFTDPDGDTISLVLNSISDAAGILSDPNVRFDPANPRVLLVPFLANTYGTATITYRAYSGRKLSAQADVLTITVTPSNDLPRLDSVRDQTVPEDSTPPPVLLTGITPGLNEDASLLTVTAAIVQQNPQGLVQNLAVNYTAPATTGTLTYTIGQDLAGHAIVRVTVNDGQGHTFSRQFDIYVTGTDDPPLVNTAADSYTLLEDQFADSGGTGSVDYTGVFTDPDGDPLTLLVHSVNDPVATNVVDDESGGVFVSASAPMALQLRLNRDANGTFAVSTGAHAGARATTTANVRTFTVLPVNDAPTATLPDNPVVDEDSAPFTVTVTDISPGPANESSQQVTAVTASVGAQTTPGLIQSVTADYTPGATSAALTVTLGEGLAGTAQINVTIQDNGGTTPGADTSTASFLVTVHPVADPPKLVEGQGQKFAAFTNDQLPSNRQVAIDLSGVFTDADGDPISLVFQSIVDDDHILDDEAPGGLVFSSSSPQTLLVTFPPDAYGEAAIVFQALAGGVFSQDTATLRIQLTPPLGAPSFRAIPALAFDEDSGNQTVSVLEIRGGLPAPGPATVQTLTAQIVGAAPADLFASVAPGDVTYTVGAETGTIVLRPAANRSGTATLRVTVTDDGTASATRAVTFTQDVPVVVRNVDDRPFRVQPFSPPTFNEDQFLAAGGRAALDLTGIFADDEGAPVHVRIISIADPDDVLDQENGHITTDPFNPERILLALNENASGSVTFTVGASANGVDSTDTDVFTLVVNPVNDPPTLDPLATLPITQQQATYSVPLTGLGVGPANESTQNLLALTPTIQSSTVPGLITNLAVTHQGNDATGTLTFSLGARFGTAVIQLAVQDDGGTARGGIDTFTRTLTVNVNITDKPPTLVQPAAPLTFLEDQFSAAAGVTTVSLTGSYADPDGDAVIYQLGAITDPVDILADEQPTGVALTGAAGDALKLTLRPNAFGAATVRYRAGSRGLFSPTYDTVQITVTPVNDAPALDQISSVSVPAGSAEKVVTLSGLNVGPRESAGQTFLGVSATVTGGAAQFAAAPSVTLDASGRTATLRFTPSNTAGAATVQVTAQDNGGTDNGGIDAVTRSFTVTVTPVDHPPVPSGAAPAYAYAEDQFAGAANLTTETLPTLFTDPDGDAVSLLLGAISDPDDVLDNENSRVLLLPGNVLQLAFVPDAHGAAIVPVYGFANGRRSEQPQNLVITVAAVNDAPLAGVPERVVVAPAQTRVSFMLELQSPGPKEQEQRLATLEATWTSHAGAPVELPALAFTRAGAVPVEIDLPGGAAFTDGTLRFTVRDDGGTAAGGVDALTRDVAFARESGERPWRVLAAPAPTVRAVTLGGVAGLQLDFAGRYAARGLGRVELVPLGLEDPAGAIDLARSGRVAGEPTQLFLALVPGVPASTVTLAYAAASEGLLAATPETFSFHPGTLAAATVAGPGESALHARPVLDAQFRPDVFALRAALETSFPAFTRWAWLSAGNDAGFGARFVEAPDGEFTSAVLQVPVTDGTAVAYETVARSGFVRRRTEADALANRLADDDQDGIPAFIERLMGLDPARRETAALHPTFVRERGRDWLELRYSRMKSRTEGVLQLERLDEQGRWVPDTTAPEILASHDESDLVRVLYPMDGTRPVLVRFRAAPVE